jgi:hypothetical protein
LFLLRPNLPVKEFHPFLTAPAPGTFIPPLT